MDPVGAVQIEKHLIYGRSHVHIPTIAQSGSPSQQVGHDVYVGRMVFDWNHVYLTINPTSIVNSGKYQNILVQNSCCISEEVMLPFQNRHAHEISVLQLH